MKTTTKQIRLIVTAIALACFGLSLMNNTTGGSNIALGFQADQNPTMGSNNIDIGNQGVAGEANTIRIGTLGTQTATYIASIMGEPFRWVRQLLLRFKK